LRGGTLTRLPLAELTPPRSDTFIARGPVSDELLGLALGDQDTASGTGRHQLTVADCIVNGLARTVRTLSDGSDAKKRFARKRRDTKGHGTNLSVCAISSSELLL